jgi:hypothetical protein
MKIKEMSVVKAVTSGHRGPCPSRQGGLWTPTPGLTQLYSPDFSISHSSTSYPIHLAADGVVTRDTMVNKQVISFYNLDFTWIFKDLKQLAKSTLVQKDKVSICGTSGSREGWTEKSK